MNSLLVFSFTALYVNSVIAVKCSSSSEVYCCAPANGQDADYYLSAAVGCQADSAICNGYKVYADFSGNADSYNCYCGYNDGYDSSYTDNWVLDCDNDKCIKDTSCYYPDPGTCESVHVQKTKSVCIAIEELGKGLENLVKGAVALGAGLIAAIGIVGLLIAGLIIYCCCCRKPTTVIVQHVQDQK
mmetsp:Transcript_184/g.296  ORF Transcript_184/g.296 Transcript_184/m.296 type:complete len:186 (-) Transcript_184:1549-2106(-)